MNMGGGGFAQHAKNVTENNRALLRSKRRARKTKKDVYGQISSTQLQFKKSTQADILKVREQMRKQRLHHLRMGWVAGGILLVLLGLLWLWLT